MNRQDIMTQLIQDIEDNFIVTKGYKTQPTKVYRGYYQFEEIKQTPALALTITTDELLDTMIDETQGFRILHITSYGYAKSNGAGDTSEIHDLLNDFENFLHSTDFTYADRLNSIGNITVYEGGISDPANIFQLDFSLIYNKE